MKRKAETTADETVTKHLKHDVAAGFGPAVFDRVDEYAEAYATSSPYKHAVVSDLIDDKLLRSVRREILSNIHFTPKETDIYKIHQSGDLANLDGLDTAALERLPSLLRLRDALYSTSFRQWIQTVSGSGPLSGKKTDMAVNVYVPGCHLLCHDDVIGSRRVSYILYLTDPDKPWEAEWGGALRLYPVEDRSGDDGKMYKVPFSSWSKSIPPAWNQLSFFAVQPGESFHDVEEVYHHSGPQGALANGDDNDGARFRMAISGWFHIPQEGEPEFEPGLEEQMAEKSSLQQLQGTADQFDEPQVHWMDPVKPANDTKTSIEQTDTTDQTDLSEQELELLLQFMTPHYLTPDTVEELNELFADESTLQLTNFLSKKFSSELRAEIQGREKDLQASSSNSDFAQSVSRPPHKHRYVYELSSPQTSVPNQSGVMPSRRLLNSLLPSAAFRKWMSLATGLDLKRCQVLARRFRRSLDYQLAQSYDGEEPQLEWTLCVTPTGSWGGGEGPGEEEGQEGPVANGTIYGSESANGANDVAVTASGDDNVGGYELYMAGDDDDDDDEHGSDDGVTIPTDAAKSSHTGAGDRRSSKRSKKADPAIYQAASSGEDDDDGILFSNPASWNTMSIVLRDRGTLRFVKYVSARAEGDRWDFSGAYEVEDDGVEVGEDGGEED
jgi:prolyl 3-hydroxylase /prolyl 3,4-dihydroxylase